MADPKILCCGPSPSKHDALFLDCHLNNHIKVNLDYLSVNDSGSYVFLYYKSEQNSVLTQVWWDPVITLELLNY